MAQETTVRYLSKFLSLKLVRKPMRTKEIEGQIITSDGSSIRFSQGVFETSDEEEIAFIEGRDEFKNGIIYRIPDDVVNVSGHEAEWRKDLETREADLARREADLAAKAAKVGAHEEGSKGDGLRSNMKKTDLLEIAANEGVEGFTEESKNDEIIAAIRAKREAAPGTEGADGGEDKEAAY